MIDFGVTAVITGAQISSGYSATAGGGIYNAGNLTLDGCEIGANSVDGIVNPNPGPPPGGNALGGGIYSTGTLTLDPLSQLSSYQFSDISIAGGATFVAVPENPVHPADPCLIDTQALSFDGNTSAWYGQLDMNSSSLIVRGTNQTDLLSQLQSGLANGADNGQGITSTAAATYPGHLTTLGLQTYMADDGFQGHTVHAGDAGIMYTFYGDATFNRVVDGSDYSQIDYGFLMKLAGFKHGDFNQDGLINGSDYTLIDNAFNNQTASSTAQIAAQPQSGRPTPPPAPASPAAVSASAAPDNKKAIDSLLDSWELKAALGAFA